LRALIGVRPMEDAFIILGSLGLALCRDMQAHEVGSNGCECAACGVSGSLALCDDITPGYCCAENLFSFGPPLLGSELPMCADGEAPLAAILPIPADVGLLA